MGRGLFDILSFLTQAFLLVCSMTFLSCEKEPGEEDFKETIYTLDTLNFYPRQMGLVKSSGRAHSTLMLATYSDIHSDYVNAERILDFCTYYSDYLDDVISLGDNIANEYSNDYSWFDRIEGSCKVLNTIGNHDSALYSSSEGYSWTEYAGPASYKKFFQPYLPSWNISSEQGLTYYYKDYKSSNVRLVVLDVMSYDDTQDAWLRAVLKDSYEKGYSVVGVSHYSVHSYRPFDCTFTITDQIESGVANTHWGLKSRIGEAYNSVEDFISYGGEFVCWLSGHLHWDSIGVVDSDGGQIIINVECATSEPIQLTQIRGTREIGTRNQDCFNVLGVNVDDGTISLIRIGHNVDIDGREKNFLSVNYRTKEVLENF